MASEFPMFLAFGVRFLRYSFRAGSVSDGQIRQRTNEGALRAGSVSDGQMMQQEKGGRIPAVSGNWRPAGFSQLMLITHPLTPH